MKIIVLLLSVILLSTQAGAESAIQCHCFQERTLDPQNPEKINPYLRATAQNSFLAIAFGMEKFDLVRRRMSGTRAEDLWVAGYLGEKTGAAPEALLSLRSREKSWEPVIAGSKIAMKNLDSAFADSLEKNRGDGALASAAADEVLARVLGADRTELSELRAEGADTQEVILSVFFGRRAGRSPLKIREEVSKGDSSWGLMARIHKVEVGEMDEEFASLIRDSAESKDVPADKRNQR